MNILVIGSGGREHALVWKIAQSPRVEKIYCAPGNGGIGEIASCIDIKADDIDGLLKFALSHDIDLTVVGPEQPLSLGIVDVFMKSNLRIFGPNQRAAILEGSKAFSKNFMQKYSIPTAKYKNYHDKNTALAEIDGFGYPLVIKADGLAAGKGVIIAEDRTEAEEAIKGMMADKKFGVAGSTIVVEEFLQGKEASILAFVDGNVAIPMVSAQDYKRALDDDKGLNTGGMGAVSPAFYYNDEIAERVKQDIINKTVEALKAENIEYRGVLYFGLMLTKDGPKLLEYNARFGDPETEVVLMRLETDLIDIMDAVIDEALENIDIKWSSDHAVCVVMTSGGYPESYDTGFEIKGFIPNGIDRVTFHAATAIKDGKTITAGGRVLVVSALGETTKEACEKAYEVVSKMDFKKAFYRKDIGIKKDSL